MSTDEIEYPLTKQQALTVLHNLAKKADHFAKAIHEESERVFRTIKVEEVASSLTAALLSITDGECINAVNNQIFGYYCDIGDTAYEFFRQEFSPYELRVKQYHDVAEHVAETAYVKGIILGLYQYQQQCTADFYTYIEDCPFNFASDLLGRMVDHHPNNPELIDSLKNFIIEKCVEWSDMVANK